MMTLSRICSYEGISAGARTLRAAGVTSRRSLGSERTGPIAHVADCHHQVDRKRLALHARAAAIHVPVFRGLPVGLIAVCDRTLAFPRNRL
jgi:hypothetical protein